MFGIATRGTIVTPLRFLSQVGAMQFKKIHKDLSICFFFVFFSYFLFILNFDLVMFDWNVINRFLSGDVCQTFHLISLNPAPLFKIDLNLVFRSASIQSTIDSKVSTLLFFNSPFHLDLCYNTGKKAFLLRPILCDFRLTVKRNHPFTIELHPPHVMSYIYLSQMSWGTQNKLKCQRCVFPYNENAL